MICWLALVLPTGWTWLFSSDFPLFPFTSKVTCTCQIFTPDNKTPILPNFPILCKHFKNFTPNSKLFSWINNLIIGALLRKIYWQYNKTSGLNVCESEWPNKTQNSIWLAKAKPNHQIFIANERKDAIIRCLSRFVRVDFAKTRVRYEQTHNNVI